eukprot:14076304-Ditylum_brightwellii.AAC.1
MLKEGKERMILTCSPFVKTTQRKQVLRYPDLCQLRPSDLMVLTGRGPGISAKVYCQTEPTLVGL